MHVARVRDAVVFAVATASLAVIALYVINFAVYAVHHTWWSGYANCSWSVVNGTVYVSMNETWAWANPFAPPWANDWRESWTNFPFTNATSGIDACLSLLNLTVVAGSLELFTAAVRNIHTTGNTANITFMLVTQPQTTMWLIVIVAAAIVFATAATYIVNRRQATA